MNIIQEKIDEIDDLTIDLYEHSVNKDIIKFGRCVGNTRRQVDLIIDCLYKDFTVKIEDHYEKGKCKSANSILLDRVVSRLNNENYSNRQTLIRHINSKDEIFIKLIR